MNPIAQPNAFTSVSPSIQGAVEILNQGRDFLLTISDSDYLTRAKPHVSSSIGEHTRQLPPRRAHRDFTIFHRDVDARLGTFRRSF